MRIEMEYIDMNESELSIADINIGDEVFVHFWEPMPLRGIVSRLVCNNSDKFVIVSINGREHRCRVHWLSKDTPNISDETFEQYWQMGGWDAASLFNWYATNYHLVNLDGVYNPDTLALAIKQTMYVEATGRSWNEYEYK
jgi:hypothetical protein